MSIKRLLKETLQQRLDKKYIAIVRHIYSLFRYSSIRDILKYYYCHSVISHQTNKLSSMRIDLHSNCNKKNHILMLAEKWNAHNPALGPTMFDWFFFGSLEASGLSTYDRLNHDEFPNQYSFDNEVLNVCLKNRPNFIFITSWLLAPLKIKTIKVIKERLKIPIIVIWGDSVNHMEKAESLLPYVKFNIPLDSSSYYLQVTNNPEKYLPTTFTPLDPNIFSNPRLMRDIDISFVGSTKDHSDRYSGIAALKSAGIDVFQSGEHKENRRSIDEAALIYKRSKISLNFCYHSNGRIQIKGRVFETTSCGSMLMEAENSETAKLFEPMVDYVSFKDEKDLVNKVKYYLDHDAEREEIAANGHRKFHERYSGKIFWQTVFKNVLGSNFN